MVWSEPYVQVFILLARWGKKSFLYFWEFAFFVDQAHNGHWPCGDHVQDVLVVLELQMLPANALGGVRLLLQLENVLHEELLQRFVGVVDAELLETANKL